MAPRLDGLDRYWWRGYAHAAACAGPRRTTCMKRRDLLKLGGAAVAAASGAVLDLGPQPAAADTPKRGGVFRLRGEDPLGFDPQLSPSYRTMTNLSFTHSRLVKVKAGPSVRPGTLPLEPDVAESWSRPDDRTYVFKLRRGVRWHPKPPVNGRELTAEDVRYTYERFISLKGNQARSLLDPVERIEAPDRYTVRFTLTEPFAWFLDGVEITVDPDHATRFANFAAGKYDFGPEYNMVLRRLDLDVARQRKPGLQTAEFILPNMNMTWLKLDQAPFSDVRVRRAMAL